MHTADRRSGRYRSFRRRLRRLEGRLRGVISLAGTVDAADAPFRVSEWLRDNDFLIQGAFEAIARGLPRGFYAQLPVLTTGPSQGEPRIDAIVRRFVDELDGEIEIDRLARFVDAYQRNATLLIAELWALPIMLRLSLLERIVDGAPGCLGSDGSGDDGSGVVNCIAGLRLAAVHDWNLFFESLSHVDRTLRQDPSGVYPLMDFESRDRYRRAVEMLARRTDWRAEEWVAGQAVELAASGPSAGDRMRHVGFWLIGEGRSRLEERIGAAASLHARLRRSAGRHVLLAYLGSIFALTTAVVVLLCAYAVDRGAGTAMLVGTFLLTVIPASSLAVSFVNFIVSMLGTPRVLPKLDFTDGIPADCRTLVAVPAMLTSAQGIDALLEALEIRSLGNDDDNLRFALLTDYTDAPREQMPGDDELLARAQHGIEELNRHYAHEGRPRFFLFHRRRQWNPSEGCWMGWERKRGKLAELNLLLAGAAARTSYAIRPDVAEDVRDVAFVITLDADTKLPRGTAARLVGTMAHPLNRAVFVKGTDEVESGYTVLQPRVSIDPARSNRTPFARLMAGDMGLDLYSHAVSDVYQDLFGEGSYFGKGIFDPRAFERSLRGRVPENSLLSHDLFEGIHGRAGFVSDVVLLEEFPTTVISFMQRRHRWVRGDWQLLPWLLPRVPREDGTWGPNRLSLLDHWKVVDNLRRSLLPPSLLALLIGGWTFLPGAAWLWTLAALGVVGASVFLVGVGGFRSAALSAQRLPVLAGTGWSVGVELARRLLSLTFLPFLAIASCDAIVRTLFRLFVSRRHLLEWVPAAHAAAGEARLNRRAAVWRHMLAVPVGTLLIAAIVLRTGPPVAILIAAPFLLLWLVSPHLAYRVGRPTPTRRRPLLDNDIAALRRIARRTWLFFEQFAGPDDNWLPPDHFQEDPGPELARRTSPTDIGMLIGATLAAYDLGYIGVFELSARLHSTLDSLDRLDRYWGHFLNWYDTATRQPLEPRYVSTVDSGNLAGALLAVARGCEALVDAPLSFVRQRQGMIDDIDLLRGALRIAEGKAAREAVDLRASLDRLRHRVDGIVDDIHWAALLEELYQVTVPRLLDLLAAWVERGATDVDLEQIIELRTRVEALQRGVRQAHAEVEKLTPWYALLLAPPEIYTAPDADPQLADAWHRLRQALAAGSTLKAVPGACRAARTIVQELEQGLGARAADASLAGLRLTAQLWNEELERGLEQGQREAGALHDELMRFAARADEMFEEMDFSFLFDRARHLLHIGFNLTTSEIDPNYYDLLASEARLASMLAIAKGDVPQSHWLHLGRPFAGTRRTRVLLSWSGTAFEYLLPTLLARTPDDSLLAQSCRAAIKEQRVFARRHSIPWGISESGYYHFDQHRRYQYRAFGVPSLGLAQGLGERLVVSPYASMLALEFQPRGVLRNLVALEELDAFGRYGFYDAIDFGSASSPPGLPPELVRSYMAHHQGMILLSIANMVSGQSLVDRFHADGRIASVEPLLHEQIPRGAPASPSWRRPRPAEARKPARPLVPWRVSTEHACKQVHLLSNGELSILISAAGAGASWCRDLALTRWRADATTDDWGTWIYVRDEDDDDVDPWSVGMEPIGVDTSAYDVQFSPHAAEFRRKEHGISLHMEVAVAADDNVEIRRITVHNESTRPRRLSLTSYAEPVLTARSEDDRHPAFAKLFVESRFDRESGSLLFRRRPRSEDDEELFLAHAIAGQRDGLSWEADRAAFLGRLGSARAPRALRKPARRLGGATGSGLDPAMVMSCEVELGPHEKATVTFLNAAGKTARGVLSLIERYGSAAPVEQAFQRARMRSAREMKDLGLDRNGMRESSELLSAVLHPQAGLRGIADAAVPSRRPFQPDLWSQGISGDLPIALAVVKSDDDIQFVQPLLRARALWKRRGIPVDVVVIDQQASGYGNSLRHRLTKMVESSSGDNAIDSGPGQLFLFAADQLSPDVYSALRGTASVVLSAGAGSLGAQLARAREAPRGLPAFVPAPLLPVSGESTEPVARPSNLLFDNGLGGFTNDGREYLIYLNGDRHPPAPWINVVAQPSFGFVISESGGGYSWADNSSEGRLTPWANDPVRDRPGEVVYLRDEETAAVWSATPQPCGGPGPYLVRHGAGYTCFEHNSHGLRQRLRLLCDPEQPVKIVSLRMTNLWDRPRRVTATYYAEWVLGTRRAVEAPFIVSEYDTDKGALLARNAFRGAVAGADAVAFLAATRPPHGVTTDRTEFLGLDGDLTRPAALYRIGLSGELLAGRDPCAALQIHIDLAAGESTEVHFLLGQGRDRQHCAELLDKLRAPGHIDNVVQQVAAQWDGLLGSIEVRTPNRGMDVLVNRWLLYQAVSCRLWGRSALYQSGGAIGFRDQLQDVLSLLVAAPELARAQILEAARHQFEEGDVLHWWHPPIARGVRTRCSDDLLWLPYVTASYVAATGDDTVLAEEVPFLSGPPLDPGEQSRYAEFGSSTTTASLYEHCIRAVERGSTRGVHGLPLIGSGDWNDALDRVGEEGRGESVWLGWFLFAVLQAFAQVSDDRDEGADATRLRQRARELRRALEESAWDGKWYLRAYFDNGDALGSASSPECRIDAISQAWSVLSGAAPMDRRKRAMQAVERHLVRDEDRLVLLLTPPFDEAPWDPGYIKGYPPGVRENGGQYTHAATWVTWAFAELGDGDLAGTLFDFLNPIYRTARRAGVERYRTEPYAVAADIYSVPPLTGRGGWSWYTGAAGWMYRLAVERILGVGLRDGRLHLDPCVPRDWERYEVRMRHAGAEYHIEVHNPHGVNRGVRRVTLGGYTVEGATLPPPSPGIHQVTVVLGGDAVDAAEGSERGDEVDAAERRERGAGEVESAEGRGRDGGEVDSGGDRDLGAARSIPR